jgi:phosphomannomutase
MNPVIFKAYDIRGIYPNQLNEADVYTITKGIFTFFSRKLITSKPPRIVLSRDGRSSSPSLFKEAIRALIESGAEVIDIGLSTTPTFYFAVLRYDYDAGIQITASHNPKEYNGMKPVIKTGEFITKIGETTGLKEVKKIIQEGKFVTKEKPGRVIKKEGVLEDQIERTFKITGDPKIAPLKIVADAANGTGALYLDALFKKLPCELIKINFDINGDFLAHQPDPSQFDTLKDLQQKITQEKADLGIAPDGDGDRIFFVDEKGKVVPASLITALISREILDKHPGAKIGFDVRNTLNALHAVEGNNGIPVVSRIGNIFSTEIMKKENCEFFGENSGHYFFKETGFVEEPAAVVLTVLSLISREKRPLSNVVKPLSVSRQSGGVSFKIENSQKMLENLEEKYKDGKINHIDGLSVDFPNWRFNVRSSNTEPVLRLNVEALKKELMEEKRDELVKLIKDGS